MGLSAYGSSEGIALAGTSSVLFAQKKSTITQAYIAVIITSTVFMYAVILSMTVMLRITSDYPLETAMKHFAGCLVYGLTGFFAGRSMGNASRTSFKILAKTPTFFFSFVLVLASIEVALIFSLIFSFLIIYSS
jgi:F0F1-type ATP synthase membrane subunit c/vacuolar-type H+-ATPase subunit K